MKFSIRVFSVGVVFSCALAGCAKSPVGSESSAPSSVPEAPVSSEPVSSEASSEPVSSEVPGSDTPAPPVSIPEVKQNPETGDSLGNPSRVPPPSWDQPGAGAEKEALASMFISTILSVST